MILPIYLNQTLQFCVQTCFLNSRRISALLTSKSVLNIVAMSMDTRKTRSLDSKLYVETPTIFSFPLSKLTGFDVYLKLENLQPPGSFKMRGLSNLIQKAVKKGSCSHVYCASGGNAGMAAAHASKQLGIPCTIILPTTTPDFIADRLRQIGAEVKVHGSVYDEAKKLAEDLSSEPGGLYAPAFEHPDIWEGHSTMIEEAKRQMPERPDVVVTSVGGGGLFNGVVQGMRSVGWEGVPVVAMETFGAHAFSAAIQADKVVPLPEITSIAKSLGSLTVSETTLEYYRQSRPRVISHLVSDKEAVGACVRFAEDHRLLVEPACGASLAAIYSNVIEKLKQSGDVDQVKTVLVIVCGGAIVSTEIIEKWKVDYQL